MARGAGQLGRAIVRTLAKAGANVAIHYNTSGDMATQLVGELKELGVGAMAVQADITEKDAVFAMRDKIVAELGA